MKFVSIVIPNYNHAQFLKQRIDSVLVQTYKHFEVIILDDCSTDNSSTIIEQYRNAPQVTAIVYNKENSGSTFKQWKKGIQLAKGEYIWFAESDDYAEPNFLAELVPQFDCEDNIDLIFCNSHVVDGNGSHIGTTNNWLHSARKKTFFNGYQFCLDHLFLLCRIPNASAVLFRRTLVIENPEWIDTSLRNSGDWKLWINIALNANLVWLNEDLNYFRKHSNNVTNSLPLLKKEALYIIKEIIHNRKVHSHYRLYESLGFWSFNSAAWTQDPRYSISNFKHYFKNNVTGLSVIYLLFFLMKQLALSGIRLLPNKGTGPQSDMTIT